MCLNNRRNFVSSPGRTGSGKTTFCAHFPATPVRNFVNADLIAAGLSPFAPERAALRAGRLMLEEIHRLAAEKADFAFETTLSGRTYEAMLRAFREQGYQIFLYFLWLPDVSMNPERVAGPCARRRANIPDDDVRRRYGRGIQNFLTVYRQLADYWIVFDNSGLWPQGGRIRNRDRSDYPGRRSLSTLRCRGRAIMRTSNGSYPSGPLHHEAIRAMREAVWEVIQNHNGTAASR